MRYPLPYAFARTHQLLLEEAAGELTLILPAGAQGSAVGEVLRKYPVRQFQAVAADVLAQRISAAYAQGESSAAAVVSEVESDADLSRMRTNKDTISTTLVGTIDRAVRTRSVCTNASRTTDICARTEISVLQVLLAFRTRTRSRGAASH